MPDCGTLSVGAIQEDVSVLTCGFEPASITPGTEVEFRMQIENATTRGDGAVIGDAVWRTSGGTELARITDFEVAPDNTRWASATATIDQNTDIDIESRYVNVRYVNPL